MQQLAIEQRRLLGPRAPWHVGDVAWGLHQHEGREDEWKFRLWEDGDRVVAWSWLKGDKLELDVSPDRRDLLDEILAEPDARTAFGVRGRRRPASSPSCATASRSPASTLHCLVRPHRAAGAAAASIRLPLPDGRAGRPRRTGRDPPRRLGTSRVTESSYANVMAAWPYRGSLDCVVEADDGRFAAYCLVWPDAENGVGELEPVGVREAFRRRGLGSAVCTFALQRLHEEGGREAIVYCNTEPACALYRSLGFRVHATVVGYSR